MMTRVLQKPHTVFVELFLITTLQTDVLQTTFSTKVNIIKNLK